jgi:riboflavin synthase
MFTGIITHIGHIESAEKKGDLRIRVASDLDTGAIKIGDSVACNGCCLTVIVKGKGYFEASLSDETISRTTPGSWERGRTLNLETALKMGDSLGGHLVTGHVDGLVKVIEISTSKDSHIMVCSGPPGLARFIAEKGSVTLDGVSLTVNRVEGAKFWVNIIPHTWQATTLARRKPGDFMNIEIDLIARYVARLMQK